MLDFARSCGKRSALTGFEPAVGLVDDIKAATAAYDTVIAVTGALGFDRILDFHDKIPAAPAGLLLAQRAKNGGRDWD